MCFSPQGDLVGGAVVTAIGIDACLHLRRRPEFVAIAVFPVLLGLHQIDETFVWWGLQGHVSAGAGRIAMWIYLSFALVVLPVLAPTIVMLAEPTRERRWRMVPFLIIGAGTAVFLATTMATHGATATLGAHHIAYTIGLPDGYLVVGAYIVATCGSLFVSASRHIRLFGILNVIAVVVLARLCATGFTSLWCGYAALVSAAIALHLRYGHRAGPKVAETPVFVSQEASGTA
jgi:hypothetical protein